MYVLTNSDYISNLATQIAEKHSLQVVRICKNAFVEAFKKHPDETIEYNELVSEDTN